MVQRTAETKHAETPVQSTTEQEQRWIRAFVAFYGTDNVLRFSVEDLGGVTLTRIHEALRLGTVVVSEKCEGPGCTCTIEHLSDNLVEVVVYFDASTTTLEIRKARIIVESKREPDAA